MEQSIFFLGCPTKFLLTEVGTKLAPPPSVGEGFPVSGLDPRVLFDVVTHIYLLPGSSQPLPTSTMLSKMLITIASSNPVADRPTWVRKAMERGSLRHDGWTHVLRGTSLTPNQTKELNNDRAYINLKPALLALRNSVLVLLATDAPMVGFIDTLCFGCAADSLWIDRETGHLSIFEFKSSAGEDEAIEQFQTWMTNGYGGTWPTSAFAEHVFQVNLQMIAAKGLPDVGNDTVVGFIMYAKNQKTVPVPTLNP